MVISLILYTVHILINTTFEFMGELIRLHPIGEELLAVNVVSYAQKTTPVVSPDDWSSSFANLNSRCLTMPAKGGPRALQREPQEPKGHPKGAQGLPKE